MKKLNFNFSENVVARLDELAEIYGMNRTAVISMLINQAYSNDPLMERTQHQNGDENIG